MVSGRLVSALLVCVSALTACASSKSVSGGLFASSHWCPGAGSTCGAEVTVKTSSSRCEAVLVKAHKKELVMPSTLGAVNIKWTLEDERYEFRRGAFQLKRGKTSKQFSVGTPSPDGKSFEVVNDHTDGELYEYELTVHLRAGSGPTPCVLDPFIRNVN